MRNILTNSVLVIIALAMVFIILATIEGYCRLEHDRKIRNERFWREVAIIDSMQKKTQKWIDSIQAIKKQ